MAIRRAIDGTGCPRSDDAASPWAHAIRNDPRIRIVRGPAVRSKVQGARTAMREGTRLGRLTMADGAVVTVDEALELAYRTGRIVGEMSVEPGDPGDPVDPVDPVDS